MILAIQSWRPENAPAISAGNSSKSAAIFTRPCPSCATSPVLTSSVVQCLPGVGVVEGRSANAAALHEPGIPQHPEFAQRRIRIEARPEDLLATAGSII